ncbi:MAG: cyclic nucleotide-binding domain-containing protein [Rhizomicrobium sp.]
MTFDIARNDGAPHHPAPLHVLQSCQAPAPRPATLVEHLAQLREFGTRSSFARNAAIFHEGDPARHIYLIVSGTVRLCRHTPDGRRHIAEFALAGDLCGVFGGGVQSFTAEAITDVTVIAYPRAQFDRLSERDPGFRANMLAHLSTHLLSAQLHTFVLGCQNAKERLASFLIRLARRTGTLRSGRIELAMGRQDIADHLGLTIETICRAITALKNEGMLAVPGTHCLVLRNAEALGDLAEGNTLN